MRVRSVERSSGTGTVKNGQYEQLYKTTEGWEILSRRSIEKVFVFKNMKIALRFIVRVGEVAESSSYGVDIKLQGWNKVAVILNSQNKQLSVRDLVVASRIDRTYAFN